MYKNNNKPDMYHRQSFPRLGDYIATVLQVTRLTKSIIRVSEALAVTLTILLKRQGHAL